MKYKNICQNDNFRFVEQINSKLQYRGDTAWKKVRADVGLPVENMDNMV